MDKNPVQPLPLLTTPLQAVRVKGNSPVCLIAIQEQEGSSPIAIAVNAEGLPSGWEPLTNFRFTDASVLPVHQPREYAGETSRR